MIQNKNKNMCLNNCNTHACIEHSFISIHIFTRYLMKYIDAIQITHFLYFVRSTRIFIQNTVRNKITLNKPK